MKKHLHLLLLVGLSLLPLWSLFTTSSLLHTHDGLVHLARIGAYAKALADGQFPVRWAGDLNYGYGMPLFNFMYQVPYLIASLLLLVGVGLVNAFKLTLALSYILAGVFMYGFAKELLQDNKKALLVAFFYQFATFRFVELLLRGSFGEVYTYTFLPLVLWGVIKVIRKPSVNRIVATAGAVGLLILSHNAVSLVFFGVIALFILFFANNKKNAASGFLSLLVGLLLTAFYWVPAIAEHKYTYGDLFMKDIYLNHFAPWYMFFVPNLFATKSLQIEGISVQIGLLHIIGIGIALYVWWKKKKLATFDKRLMAYSSVLIIGSLFFMQPISKPFWQSISLLRQFQFPWRFLSVPVFATSLLAGYYVEVPWLKKQGYFLVVGLVVLLSLAYWKPTLGYDKIDENYYWNFPLNTTYYGETDVIWSAGPAKSYPKQRIEIISGEGKIQHVTKRSVIHTFQVNAKNEIRLVDHTEFFPGWKAFVDGREVPIQFQDPNHRGELTFMVPAGNHHVMVKFTETKIRFIADIISLATVVGACILLVVHRLKIYEK